MAKFTFKEITLSTVFQPSVYINSKVLETFHYFNLIRTDKQLRAGFNSLNSQNNGFGI